MKLIAVGVLLAMMLVAGCTPDAQAPLQFDKAWIRQPVPGSEKSVGYFEVTNTTAADITLQAARADNIRKIEFHTMTMDGDMMRMRRLSEFVVPTGATIAFASGGDHLMLFGVGELGERVALTFTAQDGAEHSHPFAVVAPGETH